MLVTSLTFKQSYDKFLHMDNIIMWGKFYYDYEMDRGEKSTRSRMPSLSVRVARSSRKTNRSKIRDFR